MKPDRTEKGIRFGCGFVFGLVVGLFTALTWIIDSWSIAVIALIAAVVCGLLAERCGDAFWRSLRNWWYWT